MRQELIVAIIVGTAVAYALWRLMPARWRSRMAERTAKLARKLGLSEIRSRQVALRLENGAGCGSCSSCKSCATPAEHEGKPHQHYK